MGIECKVWPEPFCTREEAALDEYYEVGSHEERGKTHDNCDTQVDWDRVENAACDQSVREEEAEIRNCGKHDSDTEECPYSLPTSIVVPALKYLHEDAAIHRLRR